MRSLGGFGFQPWICSVLHCHSSDHNRKQGGRNRAGGRTYIAYKRRGVREERFELKGVSLLCNHKNLDSRLLEGRCHPFTRCEIRTMHGEYHDMTTPCSVRSLQLWGTMPGNVNFQLDEVVEDRSNQFTQSILVVCRYWNGCDLGSEAVSKHYSSVRPI